MHLDDRASRAADSLRSRVEPSLDLTAARAAVGAGSVARQSRLRRLRVTGAVVAVIGVLGLVAVANGIGGSGDGDEHVATEERDTGNQRNSREASAAQILAGMPRGPVDGKESYKLPVLAQPQSGLADGDTVTIYGKGFLPNDALGIVQCSAEADSDGAGIGACQLASTPGPAPTPNFTPEQRQAIDDYLAMLPEGTDWNDTSEPLPDPPALGPIDEELGYGTIPEGTERLWDAADQARQAWEEAGGEYPNDTYGAVTYVDADANGEVVADFVVHRYITTPDGGEIDCMSAAERCIVGMGAISDYDRSGGSYIGFEGQPDFAEPSLSVDPAGDPAGTFAPGQAITVQVEGWVSKRQVRISQCVGNQCQTLQDGKADDDGNASLDITLQPTIVDSETGEQIACEDQCVLRANGIGTKGQTSAPLPDDVELAFTSAEPSAPLATVPATTAPLPAPETSSPAAYPPGDPCNDPGPTTDCALPGQVPTTSLTGDCTYPTTPPPDVPAGSYDPACVPTSKPAA